MHAFNAITCKQEALVVEVKAVAEEVQPTAAGQTLEIRSGILYWLLSSALKQVCMGFFARVRAKEERGEG